MRGSGPGLLKHGFSSRLDPAGMAPHCEPRRRAPLCGGSTEEQCASATKLLGALQGVVFPAIQPAMSSMTAQAVFERYIRSAAGCPASILPRHRIIGGHGMAALAPIPDHPENPTRDDRALRTQITRDKEPCLFLGNAPTNGIISRRTRGTFGLGRFSTSQLFRRNDERDHRLHGVKNRWAAAGNAMGTLRNPMPSRSFCCIVGWDRKPGRVCAAAGE